MSLNLNKVHLAGRVSWKGELKVIPSGKTILNIQIAISEYGGKNEDGTNKEPKSEFVSCVIWGKSAEFAYKYFDVGTPIYVEGSLKTTEYDKQGVKVKQTNVYVNDVRFAGDKQKTSSPQTPQTYDPAPMSDSAPQDYQTAFEPELPF